MKISTKGRYALKVMIDLAQHNDGEYISLKEIAVRQDISIKYLETIISLLNKAGFVESLRGKSGGYRLTRVNLRNIPQARYLRYLKEALLR